MRDVSEFPGETKTQQRLAWCSYALNELGLSRRETAEMLAEMEGLTVAYSKTMVYGHFQGLEYRRPERDMRRGNKRGWYEKYRQRLAEEALVEIEPSVKEIVKKKEGETDEFVY